MVILITTPPLCHKTLRCLFCGDFCFVLHDICIHSPLLLVLLDYFVLCVSCHSKSLSAGTLFILSCKPMFY